MLFAEAQQWGFGFSKSSDFQGSTEFHVSVPLYLPRQVPHSGVTESYHHTTPNVNLHSNTSEKDLYNSAIEMEKNPKYIKQYKF